MANINLASSESQVQLDEEKKTKMISGGIIVAGIMLVLTIAAYAGIVFFSNETAKKITGTKEAYDTLYQELKKGNAKDVVDFQNRLGAAKELISEEKDVNAYLKIIERSMVPGVYLDGYSYDSAKGTILLSCAGDNYNSVAKQVLSLKKEKCFSSVKVDTTSFDDESGKINFPLGISLNTQDASSCE